MAANLIDPAMSRLYYSLFQAGVHAMGKLGKRPRDLGRSDTWEHGTICGNATLFRKTSRDFQLFRSARSLREQADYREAPVDQRRVQELLPAVAAFVEEVCS